MDEASQWMKSRADHFVFGVFEDALEVRLAGLLHRGGDLGVAGVLHGAHREVDEKRSASARETPCR